MASGGNSINIPFTQIENFMKSGIPNNFNSDTPVLNNQPTTPVPTTADVYGTVLNTQNLKGIGRGFYLSSVANEWLKAVYYDAIVRGEWTLDDTLRIEQFSLLAKHAEEIEQRVATDVQYTVNKFAPDSMASGPNA